VLLCGLTEERSQAEHVVCGTFPNPKVASVHSSVASSISLFEKREELRRVLESKYFANSPKKTRFLEFVSEQAFQGNGEKLNEYLIGVEVYDRGVDFNAQKDPIVRVQAHEIRRLLHKYYEEKGCGLIRLDLPSGQSVQLACIHAAPPKPPWSWCSRSRFSSS